MVELFTELGEENKQVIQELVDMAINAPTYAMAKQILKQARDTCSEEEQEFMDFYFQLKMEELGVNGEGNSNQW